MIIKTAADYWGEVDKHWDNLLCIIADQMDLAHLAYDPPGDANGEILGRTILEELTRLKKIKDPKIVRYFNAAWGLASDSYAFTKPSWGALCDLCSEEWVLHPEQCEPAEVSSDVGGKNE